MDQVRSAPPRALGRASAKALQKAKRVLLDLLLWAAIVVSLFGLIRTRYGKPREMPAAAEWLLVFVIAVEGLVAISELRESTARTTFETELRIYDFFREVHALHFRGQASASLGLAFSIFPIGTRTSTGRGA